ncbi:MAG: hypothetical protein M3R66_17180 [Actinomycetota bacterium]|jgi:fermentation-respiration switch protein FrsA (DUF1100 family)|nr:hypothetical protein [Actinomycetota bacterium]
MILADQDTTTPSDVARAVFDRAGEPEQLLEFPGGHYDVFEDDTVQQRCIAVTTDFLLTQLNKRPTPPSGT